MNVRELIEALEDYGDHLEVVVIVTDDLGNEKTCEFAVDDANINGEVRVELGVDL